MLLSPVYSYNVSHRHLFVDGCFENSHRSKRVQWRAADSRNDKPTVVFAICSPQNTRNGMPCSACLASNTTDGQLRYTVDVRPSNAALYSSGLKVLFKFVEI